MTHHPYEAILASEVSEAAIASMAHMTDADIQAQIERITALQSSLEYGLGTRMAVQNEDRRELHAYRVELVRRRVAADEPVNLLDAVRALRSEPAGASISLNTVTDFMCAVIAASTSLDTPLPSLEADVHPIAAE